MQHKAHAGGIDFNLDNPWEETWRVVRTPDTARREDMLAITVMWSGSLSKCAWMLHWEQLGLSLQKAGGHLILIIAFLSSSSVMN